MKEKLFAALLAPTIIAGALGVWYLVTPKSESSPKHLASAEPEDWRNARMACEKSIEKRLHDPKSAQFPSRSEFRVIPVERDGYDVFASVRARNGFNAMRLSSYKCEIRQLSRSANGGLTWQANVLDMP